jgi:hypothetical protein
LQVPSLSGIQKLEPISEQEVRSKEKNRKTKASSARSIRTKQVVTLTGAIAFVVASLLFVFVSLIKIQGVSGQFPFIQVRSAYPQLYDVCLMQRYYVHDGKVIGRDTQPISSRDFRLMVDERIIPQRYLVWTESVIK